MHTIHTTAGFIVSSKPYGEAGKVIVIFTRDFGLVYATAQGIRLEKSKLRYETQDYSFGTYSLVKGREYWRLTSANSTKDDLTIQPFNNLTIGAKTIEKINHGGMELIARIAMLLRRLLHGEEAHPELFDCICECAKFLARAAPDQGEILTDVEMQTLESLIVARMLHALGYIGNIPELDAELKSTEVDAELLGKISGRRILLNQHINKALKESML